MSSHYFRYFQKKEFSSKLKNRLFINKTPIKYSSSINSENNFNPSINLTNHTNCNTNCTETIDNSSRVIKSFLIEEKPQMFLYIKKRINSNIKKKEFKKKKYTNLNIGKIEFEIPKKYEGKNNNNSNIICANNSQTFFFEKKYINSNSLKWNNISFKDNFNNYENEIKRKIGQLSKTISISDPYLQYNKKEKPLKHCKTSDIVKSMKNNIDKIEKKMFKKRVYNHSRKRNIFFNSNNITDNIKEMNRTADKIDNNKSLNKIKNKYLYKFKIAKENDINKDKGEKIKDLYNYFKNHKIPKFNTKLNIKNIQRLKMKKNINKINKEKKCIKIQSIWKGFQYRKRFSFYFHMNKFKNIINSFFNKNRKLFAIEFFKNVINKINFEKSKTNNIKYKEYLNHFNSNLNIINNEKLLFHKEKQKTTNLFGIINFHFSLINNRFILKEICHNDSINITNSNTLDYLLLLKNHNSELVEESQINLDTEIKGIKMKKSEKFQNCLIDKQKNNLNILQTKKDRKKNKDINNDYFPINNTILNIIAQNYSLERKDKMKKTLDNVPKIKNKYLIQNERFSLTNNNKSNQNKKTLKYLIKKNENIFFLNKRQKINLKLKSIDNFYFKGKNIEYCNKSTETDDELNKIEIKRKDKKNYNINNEIDIEGGLEINPIEIKKSNNSICNQNKMVFLNNKEKAQNNIMKIIFPIRIKSVIKSYITKYVFYILINKIKNISFINDKYTIEAKKIFFEKMKKINTLYYKNYYLNHKSKNKIRNLFNEYAIYIKKNFLMELRDIIFSIK